MSEREKSKKSHGGLTRALTGFENTLILSSSGRHHQRIEEEVRGSTSEFNDAKFVDGIMNATKEFTIARADGGDGQSNEVEIYRPETGHIEYLGDIVEVAGERGIFLRQMEEVEQLSLGRRLFNGRMNMFHYSITDAHYCKLTTEIDDVVSLEQQ